MTLCTMQVLPLKVSDIIDHAAENHGDCPVISYDGKGQRHGSDYATVGARARRLAGYLNAAGLTRGERVATLAWNTKLHLELYYAVPGAGGVTHTLNPRVSAAQIGYMLDVAQPPFLFYDTDLAPVLEAALHYASARPMLVELTGGTPVIADARPYEEIVAEGRAIDWVDVAETDPCGLCFTSGTTGMPKGVQYTHRSTVLHAMACCAAEGQSISTRETVLPVVPMFHANAWGLPFSAPMAGAALVLPGRRLDGDSLLDACGADGVTFLCGVPTIWQSILDALARRETTLGSVTRAGIGGAAPSRSMIAAIEAMGADVFHAWGMTETNPFGGTGFLSRADRSLSVADRQARKTGQGRPIFGLDRRIVDDAGSPLRRDGRTPGRLMVRGHWVIDHYVNSDSPILENGWFDTGDIATIAPDGNMRIVDRSKDLIKSGGEWISSIDIEAAALSQPEVALAAAVPRAHPKWGERPHLVVVAAAGKIIDIDLLLVGLRSVLNKWQVPDTIEVRDTLPIGSTGKVDKLALRGLRSAPD